MQPRVVAIVQARIGSTRLPDKPMLPLAGRPILEHVLRRVRRAHTLDDIVLAIPEGERNAPLDEVGRRLETSVVHGPESDVLARFVRAMETTRADVVVRVCADNPLVAPEEIDRIVSHHLTSEADYSFNHIPARNNHYPDGLGAEVVWAEVLRRIDECATNPGHREHVTKYLWDHADAFRIETVLAPPEIAGPDVKLDVNTPADLRRLETLLAGLSPDEVTSLSAGAIVGRYREAAS